MSPYEKLNQKLICGFYMAIWHFTGDPQQKPCYLLSRSRDPNQEPNPHNATPFKSYAATQRAYDLWGDDEA